MDRKTSLGLGTGLLVGVAFAVGSVAAGLPDLAVLGVGMALIAVAVGLVVYGSTGQREQRHERRPGEQKAGTP